ncbi:hypothetical protein GMMP1_1590001 [Candidatus Magnetomoraceae bacterium gMMP-1]
MLCSPNLRQLPVATFKTIDINSVSTSDVRTIGGKYLVLSQLKEYKFDNILLCTVQKINKHSKISIFIM